MKVENVRAPSPVVESASLHKKMMQLMSSLWVTRAIGTFARLSLADAMEGGAASPEAIARPKKLDPARVYRLLRALSTVGIVTEDAKGHFSLTPLGRLLGSHSPHSMQTAAILLTEYHADIWAKLDDALAGGTAFDALKGAPLWAWLAKNPAEGARFQRMMQEVHGPETPAIVAAYPFGKFKHIIDVGGGNGSLLSAILAANPGLNCSLFDLPEGIAAAKRGDGGPLPGVKLVAGNVFDSVPEGGDLYLLRHLVHDYDDDDALRILKNVRRAMRPDARVLVLEKPVPVDDTPGPGRWLDLHVMLLTGGAERTLKEYDALFARADLKLAQNFPTAHPAIEGIEAIAADRQ